MTEGKSMTVRKRNRGKESNRAREKGVKRREN